MGKTYIDEKYSSKEYLVNKPYVFKENRIYIALKFIEEGCDVGDISQIEDEEIKNILVDTYKYELIKNLNGEELYNKICEEYLGIKEEPKEIHKKYRSIAQMHLKEIDENIKCLNSILEKNKSDTYDKRKIKYYLKKNKQEIENIQYFLNNKIKKISYMESIYPDWNETGIYRYAEFPKGFYIENEYNIRIKFYEKSVAFREELEVKYRKNNEEYYKYANQLLENNKRNIARISVK